MAESVAERLARTPATPTEITPRTFRENGSTQVNTTGEESQIAELTLDTPIRLRSGRDNPFSVAVPAYEKLGPTNGTGGDTESFGLSHDLIDTPNTQDVVVYLDGTYYGNPDSVDYANNSIDITDPNTGSDVYVWYITGESATVTLRKAVPNAQTSASARLWTNQLARLHQQDQNEQPEFFSFDPASWKPYLASDMKLRLYIDAPYPVRFEDPDGHGNTPTNMLFHVPVEQAQDQVSGLIQAIKASMGR